MTGNNMQANSKYKVEYLVFFKNESPFFLTTSGLKSLL